MPGKRGNPNWNKPSDGFVRGAGVSGNPDGRPLNIDPEEFYTKGMAFCLKCEKDKKTPTIAGLCRFVGISMRSYYNYAKREEFAFEIEQVQLRIVEGGE